MDEFIQTSTFVPVAQLDRAFACGAKGRRFKSYRAYQDLKTKEKPDFLGRFLDGFVNSV